MKRLSYKTSTMEIDSAMQSITTRDGKLYLEHFAWKTVAMCLVALIFLGINHVNSFHLGLISFCFHGLQKLLCPKFLFQLDFFDAKPFQGIQYLENE